MKSHAKESVLLFAYIPVPITQHVGSNYCSARRSRRQRSPVIWRLRHTHQQVSGRPGGLELKFGRTPPDIPHCSKVNAFTKLLLQFACRIQTAISSLSVRMPVFSLRFSSQIETCFLICVSVCGTPVLLCRGNVYA
jgi:hypothetical protein